MKIRFLFPNIRPFIFLALWFRSFESLAFKALAFRNDPIKFIMFVRHSIWSQVDIIQFLGLIYSPELSLILRILYLGSNLVKFGKLMQNSL